MIMKKLSIVIIHVLFIVTLQGQITLNYLNVSPNTFVTRTLATYSFSGAGTDTIGVFVTDMGFNVVKTIKINFVVSQGLYQDSIIMDNFANGQYRVALTHGTTILQSVAVIKDISANIQEIKNGFSIKIFPNPHSTQFNVGFDSDFDGNLSYKVTNIFGQEVLKGIHKANFGKNVLKVPSTDISNGVYIFIIFNGSNQVFTQKLIKE